MHLNGESWKMSLNAGKLARNEKMDGIFMFVKTNNPRELSVPDLR